MIIRTLEKKDFQQITKLLKQLSTIDNLNENVFREFLDKLNKSHMVIVIENEEQLIACGTLLIESKLIHCSKNGSLGKVAHIEDIVIDKEYRGKGIGTMLMQHLITIAKNNDCYKVNLYCDDNVKHFYLKKGFIEKNSNLCMYL